MQTAPGVSPCCPHGRHEFASASNGGRTNAPHPTPPGEDASANFRNNFRQILAGTGARRAGPAPPLPMPAVGPPGPPAGGPPPRAAKSSLGFSIPTRKIRDLDALTLAWFGGWGGGGGAGKRVGPTGPNRRLSGCVLSETLNLRTLADCRTSGRSPITAELSIVPKCQCHAAGLVSG